MKILFLDFDGVLHPSLPRQNERFALAPMLSKTLDGYDCDVVVSSSWRFQLDTAQLRLLLPKPLSARIVGFTGEAISGRFARHREIQAWIKRHSPCDWRALDDSAFEFPSPCPELIHCDGGRGVTSKELSAIVAWLENR